MPPWIELGRLKRSLRPDVRARLDTLAWLLDDEHASEGRTSALMVTFFELALKQQGGWVGVFDHNLTYGDGANKFGVNRVLEMLKTNLRSLHIDDQFEFRDNTFRFVGKSASK